MARFEREPSEFTEKLVSLNRVSKTVKGGRIFKFAALMVVGDEKGAWASAWARPPRCPEAIRKGIEDAKKNMCNVTLSGTTIPHEVIGEFGAGRVLLKPAKPRYRRYRRRCCPCRAGDSRHQGHLHQVPAL